MMKKVYFKPIMSLEVFTPQSYCDGCSEETMYTIIPVSVPGGGSSVYMEGSGCSSSDGPVVPNTQPIDISKDAYPTIVALLENSMTWRLGHKEHGSFVPQTEFVYYSIATSSNSYGGHINTSNVGTFHATICGDNASRNALIVLDASGGIIKNRS